MISWGTQSPPQELFTALQHVPLTLCPLMPQFPWLQALPDPPPQLFWGFGHILLSPKVPQQLLASPKSLALLLPCPGILSWAS